MALPRGPEGLVAQSGATAIETVWSYVNPARTPEGGQPPRRLRGLGGLSSALLAELPPDVALKCPCRAAADSRPSRSV